MTSQIQFGSNAPTDGPSLALHAVSTLMTDLMPSGELSVAASSPAAVALFANPFRNGQVEALVVDASGRLTYLKRGERGWLQTPLQSSGPTPATEVVVAVTPDGGVWAFWTDAETTLSYARLGDGSTSAQWTVTKTPSRHWKNLKVAYTAGVPDRSPILYGLVSERRPAPYENSVMLAEWNREVPGKWVQQILPPPRSKPDALVGMNITLYRVAADATHAKRIYRLIGVRRDGLDGRTAAIHFFDHAADGSLDECTYRFDTTFDGVVDVLMSGPVDRFGLYLMSKAAIGEIVTDGKHGFNRLYTDSMFEEAVAFSDYNMMMHVYGRSADGTVSVLHQTGWRTEKHESIEYTLPVWAKGKVAGVNREVLVALPFDKDAKKLYIDAFPDSRPTILILHKHGEPVLATQDLTTGEWCSEVVHLDSSAPAVEVSAYRTQVTLVNAQGAPVPGHRLSVSAESLVQVSLGGSSVLLGPDASVDVTTDFRGRVTLSVLAAGVTTPNLVMKGAGLANGIVVKPDAAVQNYLAGTGSLPHMPAFTGSTLKGATLDGQPLVPPSTWPKDDPKFADNVVGSMQQVFGAGGSGPKPTVLSSDGSKRPIVGFCIQALDSGECSYRAFHELAELESARTALHATRLGGALDDVGQFFQDLWHGVQRAGAELKSAIVNVVQGIVHLTVRIGDALIELGEFVIKSFKDAANVVMAIFNTLKVEAKKVVDWLRALFDYKDIWDTKTALESALGRFPTFLSDTLREHGVTSDKIVAALQAHERDALANIDALTLRLKGQKLQDLPNWNADSPLRAQAPDTVLVRTASRTVTRGDLDGPQANWLMDLLLPTGAPLLQGKGLPDLSTAWNNFGREIKGVDFSLGTTFRERFQRLFDSNNPDSVGAIVIDGLMELLKELTSAVFRLVGAIAKAALELLNAVLRTADRALNDPLTFEPLVRLVHWIEQQAHPGRPSSAVTLGSVGALLMAFPVTVAWKLILGVHASPFPGGKVPPARTNSVGAGGLNPFVLTAGLLQLPYTIADIANDLATSAKGGKPFQFAVWLAICIELVQPIFLWPTADGIPFTPLPGHGGDKKQWARYYNWGPGVAIGLLDLLSALSSTSEQRDLARNRGIDEIGDWVGKLVISILGLNNFIAGINDSIVNDAKQNTFSANVLTPLSPMFQVLRISKDPKLVIAKLVLTLAGDGGGALARAASAFE